MKKKVFYPQYTDLYFFLSPEKFYLNHFPRDSSWLLINKTRNDFARLPLFYDHYLKSDVRIISPSDGVISIAEEDTIVFKFSNVPDSHSISFQYSKSQYSEDKLSFEREPKVWNKRYCEFEIANSLTGGGYLTVLLDLKPIATYKISAIQ
jgi:hypothetical protein